MKWLQQIANATPTAMAGRVSRIDGLVLAVRDFPAPIGALVEHPHPHNPPLCGEVVGFRGNETVIFPFGSTWYLFGIHVYGDPKCRSPESGFASHFC